MAENRRRGQGSLSTVTPLMMMMMMTVKRPANKYYVTRWKRDTPTQRQSAMRHVRRKHFKQLASTAQYQREVDTGDQRLHSTCAVTEEKKKRVKADQRIGAGQGKATVGGYRRTDDRNVNTALAEVFRVCRAWKIGLHQQADQDKTNNFVHCKIVLYRSQVGERRFCRLHARYATDAYACTTYPSLISRRSKDTCYTC